MCRVCLVNTCYCILIVHSTEIVARPLSCAESMNKSKASVVCGVCMFLYLCSVFILLLGKTHPAMARSTHLRRLNANGFTRCIRVYGGAALFIKRINCGKKFTSFLYGFYGLAR